MKKLIFLCALVAFAGFASAELLNLDFEDGMTGWGSWGSGSGDGGYVNHWAYVETTGGSDGGQFMNVTTEGSNFWGYNVVWRSDTAELMTVAEGDWLTLGGYYKDLSGDGGTGGIKFEWLDASGLHGNEGGLVPAVEIAITPTTEWAYYEATMQAPALAFGLRPVWGAISGGAIIGIDQMVAIPEPMSIALLGLGGLFLRRRK